MFNPSKSFLISVASSLVAINLALACVASADSVDQQVEALLQQLTLEEKINYINGAPPGPGSPNSTGANIRAVTRLGLPELATADGPVGIRVPGSSSTRYPANLLLAATWDPERAGDEGIAIGRNARARGFHVWFGPGANMYRVPVGGRNSEYLCGEDPWLGSQLVVPFIRGAQAQGVVATVKHLVANDQDYNRYSINNVVDQRTLHEIYFPVFESAVRKGRVSAVMDAYNQLNGVFCSQDPFLNQTLLDSEWRFDGIKVSDYGAVHDGLKAAQAGLDVEFPTDQLMGPAVILPALNSGQLSLANLNDKVRRILRTIVEYKFNTRSQLDRSIALDDPFSTQAGLNTAREGITLLKNDSDLLPFQRGRARSVAVVGRYAQGDPPSEGGSGSVVPVHYTSEIEGISQAAGGATKIDYLREGNLDFNVSDFRSLAPTGQYQAGLKAEYYTNQDLSGSPVLTRQELHLSATFPSDAPPQTDSGPFSVRWSGEVLPPVTGEYVFKFQYNSNVRIYLAGQKIFDDWDQVDPIDLVHLKLIPSKLVQKVHLQVGQPVAVRLEYKDPGTLFYISIGVPVASVGLAWAPIDPPVNLGTYDAVVITAGFDQSYESEGGDRPYDLPEYQDDLIQKMAAANRHIAVVLHGGGGMGIQKWINQVPALIHAFFPGQDGGRALADILFGDVNPSGKLPFTFEKRFQDNPAYANYPADLSVDATGNTAVYKEGIFVGYRGFDKNGIEPQYPFGYGLSYTTFSYSDLKIERTNEKDRQAGGDGEKRGLVKANFNEHGDTHQDLAKVSFTVTNTGECAGLETAQLYVTEQNPTVPRPIKELKGFEKVFLRPGESRRVTLELDQRSFAYFNTATAQWDALPDTYDILVGASSSDLPLKARFTLTSELTSKP